MAAQGPPPKKAPPAAAPPGSAAPKPTPAPAAKAPPRAAPKAPAGQPGKVGTRLSTGSMAERQNASLAAKAGDSAKPDKEAKEPAPAAATFEDKLVAQSWVKEINEPALFKEFCARLLPALAFGHTTQQLLLVFSNTDERAAKVKQLLSGNPYYQNQFLKHVEAFRGGKGDAPSLDSAIVLRGMENSRNLLAALQLMRTVLGTHADWDTDGKLQLDPAGVLKFALKADEAMAGRKDSYSSTAFSAGLVFDYLVQCATKQMQDPKAVLLFIEQLFAHGLKSARVGMLLADQIPDFTLKKFVFSGCLLHDVGKAALAIFAPQYVEFYDEARKRELPRAVRQFAEQKRFGLGHPLLSSLICRATVTHQQLEQAVLYHHAPYQLIRMGNRNAHALSSLICVASNVANQLRKPENPNDPVFDRWITPELKGFSIRKELVGQASERVLRDGE
ncbi:MAG: HDOD domain-containing protein [Bdellovibrionales bacterium]|nr:HDOD domain-containing protein [Bdellovibrionales bacterium]